MSTLNELQTVVYHYFYYITNAYIMIQLVTVNLFNHLAGKLE